MTTTLSCSPGHSPDILLRLSAPVGPFSEPWGQDCYFHLAAFEVLGSLAGVVNVLLFVLVLVDFLPRRGSVLMQLGSAGVLITCVSNVAFVVCGVYAPLACRALWSVSLLGALLSITSYLWRLVTTGTQVIKTLYPKMTMVDLYGGPVRGGLFFAVFAGSTVLTVLAAAVSAAVFSPLDGQAAAPLIAQQIQYVSLAVCSLCVFYCQHVYSTKFLEVVEEITSKAASLRQPHQQPDADIQAMVTRTRACKRAAPVAIPVSSGLNLLHAFVLPPLSFLVLLHIVNTTFVGIVSWIALTPTKRRMRAWRIVTFGFWGGSSAGGGGGSKSGSRTGGDSATPNFGGPLSALSSGAASPVMSDRGGVVVVASMSEVNI